MRVLFIIFSGILLQVSLARVAGEKKGRVVDCTDMRVSLLCGSDAVTYLNLCEYYEARAKDPELTIEESGGCSCPPRDKFYWNPICGTDDQLYANICELDRARNYITVRAKHLGLCKEFMEREDILYRDLQKIYKWKKFMPRDLFNELVSRPLVDDAERKPETTTPRKKKKQKLEDTGEIHSTEDD